MCKHTSGELKINTINWIFPVRSFDYARISLTGVRKKIYFSEWGVWEFLLTKWLTNMSYRENKIDFEIVEEEPGGWMFSNEMFPPLCIAPAVCLRQAEGAFQKSRYSSLHSSMLFFFSARTKSSICF